jgi:hypothetical protein
MVLGIVSVVLLLGCVWGGHWAAAPPAVAGIACGAAGRPNRRRVAGLVLSGVVLAFAVSLMLAFGTIMGTLGLASPAAATDPDPLPTGGR